MSTRHSFFLHEDEKNVVKIHIFRELANFDINDIRIEIETPHAIVNVPWPLKAYEAEALEQAKLGWFSTPSCAVLKFLMEGGCGSSWEYIPDTSMRAAMNIPPLL